jgi:hypothetical protein
MENYPDMTLQNIRYAVCEEGRDKKLRCSMMLQQRPVLDMILSQFSAVNPLNAELNPICHLLALLGAPHILHVSRIRVNIFITFFTIMQFNIISHLSLLELSQVVCD